jgi:hypothetical protein
MRKQLAKAVLFAVLLLLSGCSMVQLGYGRGPQLAWWWLDSYADFNREQKPHAKQAIRHWFDWHRSTQLPEYADWLAAVRNRITEPVTPEQICRWSDELQDILAPAFDQAVHLGAPVILSLDESQRRHLEQRYAKSNEKLRRDYLQPDPKDRLNAAIKRSVKRIENLYGKIDQQQRDLIIASIEVSPFNPELWLAERQRLQQVTLTTLQQLADVPLPPEQAATALRRLINHTHRSDNPDYRAYQIKLTEYTCNFIARMHDTTTPTQRRHAHDKLKNWENDLRQLTGEDRVYTASE